MDEDNPILDSKMHEFKYSDGYVASMKANIIAENLFVKVDQEGNRFVLIESINDPITDGTQTLQQYTFVIKNGVPNEEEIQLKNGKSASNGSMAVLHRTNLNISRIRIHYKWKSKCFIIEFRKSQNLYGGLTT